MPTNWGLAAGGAQDAMQQMLEQRILQERMALMQRQQQAEEQWRASQLGEQRLSREQQGSQFGERLGFDRTVHASGEPSRIAGVRLTNTQADTGEYTLGRAKGDDADQAAALAELGADPKTAGIARFKRARVTMPGIDPSDPTGETDQARALERIKAGGDQNVRSAAAGRSGRTVTVKTVDADGNPVTKIIPLDEAIGQEYDATPTAEFRNRAAGSKRATAVVSAIDDLSQRINTQAGLMATMAGGTRKVAAQANYDDDVAQYQSLVMGFTPLVARALGHTGVLTEQDVASVREIFPKPGDQKSLRDRKMTQVKTIIDRMFAADAGSEATPVTGATSAPTQKRYDANGKLIP